MYTVFLNYIKFSVTDCCGERSSPPATYNKFWKRETLRNGVDAMLLATEVNIIHIFAQKKAMKKVLSQLFASHILIEELISNS